MSNEESDRKLAELILYISKKCANDYYFGATKLNKILYFSDFLAYGNWGKPITEAEYQNLRKGPAPIRLRPIRRELEESGALIVRPVLLVSGHTQHRTIAFREPDLSLFDGNEIALVDFVIEKLAGLNAEETSELSHRRFGWKSTREGDTIPYETIFLSDAPLSESELRGAKE